MYEGDVLQQISNICIFLCTLGVSGASGVSGVGLLVTLVNSSSRLLMEHRELGLGGSGVLNTPLYSNVYICKYIYMCMCASMYLHVCVHLCASMCIYIIIKYVMFKSYKGFI